MRYDEIRFIDPTQEITVLEQQRYNSVHMTSNTAYHNKNVRMISEFQWKLKHFGGVKHLKD